MVLTVIVRFCEPTLPAELNTIFIFPSLPGIIGASGFSAAVHPQVTLTSVTINGVLPVFLNIKKPYISTNWEHTSPSRQGSFAKDLGVSVGEETTFLKGKNHDGVISTDEDYAEYLIYNPNQIKSATNNVGTFSNESNDIRFQVKDGLKEFVEDAKKEGYTKQETIDYVKDNNPEINEQDVIDTWDAVNEKAVDEKKEPVRF